METLLPKSTLEPMKQMLSVIKTSKEAEVEFKVLINQIETKDVADRIVRAIEEITRSASKEEHRATFTYPDGIRVVVTGPENIHKVCTSNSFHGVPLYVEKKRKYYDVMPRAGQDEVEIPDLFTRLTLRHEQFLRKDFAGKPMDPNSYVRVLHRKSWKTEDGMFQIDLSSVKSKKREHTKMFEVLKQPIRYELEIELIDRTKDDYLKPSLALLQKLVAAYQQSPFVVLQTDIERYDAEFKKMSIPFVNPITMERSHANPDNPHNILKNYTVTVKADGQRCFLVVMRDRKMIRITPSYQIAWTGLTAKDDKHFGDIVDCEYLEDKNLFCVFDIYMFRGKDTRGLPLMTTADETIKHPLLSRLGCAREFVSEYKNDFTEELTTNPIRIETKEFRAGDGAEMQESIQKILDTDYGYPTDGLIFTPRASSVAPLEDRKGKTWLRVYKWKPSDQNSIDFLLRFTPGESFDPVLNARVLLGTLYVSRRPGSEIIYPCETVTGEYSPPKIPDDLRVIAESRDRVPSPFYPAAPRNIDAHVIRLPVNDRGIPVDITDTKIEDNTIVECAYNTDNKRWTVLRTRYDKTYQYRVKKEPQYGNDAPVADSIWRSMHAPITDEMIRNVATNRIDDTIEDELYYKDDMGRETRIWLDVTGFHNRIKEVLYKNNIKKGDTLLELAVGRGGDINKWIKSQPSKVVGIDISDSNLNAPRSGLCVRYLEKKRKGVKIPPGLFFKADMSQPLEEQEGHYLRILEGTENAPTEYLEQFHGLNAFDTISCQFAIHYACATEETFKTFIGNLTKHGKGLFFGTCLDGRSVYSLLLGKPNHVFRSNQGIFGEFIKDYEDGAEWTEEFGKQIRVKLETFEQEQKEYLVPFEKVKSMMAAEGYELVEEKMFGDYYANQNAITLGQEQQQFSFLHKSFVFKKGEKPKPAPEPVKEEVPVVEEKKIEEVKNEEGETVKRKIVKVVTPKEEEVEPILFNGSDESKGDFRMLSNDYVAPFQMDSIKFPTVEHAYEYAKAKTFGDEKMAALIAKTPSAKSVKALGKKISGFKEEEWEQKQDSVMKAAIKAKLSQHPEIRSVLSETKASPIGYANARDKYWGIGTSPEKDKAKTPSKWAGKNQLGKIMEELRTEFNSSSP